jgi:flagellin
VPASFSASSTLGALVGTLNGLAPEAGSASYNSSNGQLTLSVANDGHATDGFFDQSPSGGLLDDLGFGNSVAATPATGANYETATLSLTSSGSLAGPLDIKTIGRAASTLKRVKSALSRLATDRATVGANMASLGFSMDQLGTLKDNLSAANSRIRDVDVADESTRFSRYQILMQAGTALLAQANSTPQSILRLLQ